LSDRFMNNPAYVEYEALLRKLHQVTAHHGNDSAEAESVREQMDAPERRLNRWEINRLNGLSADLYMLRGEEVLQSPAIEPDSLYRQIKEHQSWNDWDAVLSLLRHRPSTASHEAAALSRARAYESLGHYDAALLFLEFAYRNNAGDPFYQALRIRLLADAGHLSRAASDAEHTLATRTGPPLLLIAAADVLVEAAQNEALEFAQKRYERILSSLNAVLKETPRTSGLTANDFVLGELVRAACLFGLRNFEHALAALRKAVEADPGDLAMRSIYERARSEASEATRAISLNDALNHARDLVRRSGRDLIAA
jgi:tetratricopeptide (TPR) repeat protein